MLTLLSNLFQDMNAQHIRYAIYKGLAHLDDDLSGNGGDIDIITPPKQRGELHDIMCKHGLENDIRDKGPYFYLGLDEHTHKTILLDVVDKLYMGPKHTLHFSADINLQAVNVVQTNNITTFESNEYICTLIVMGLLRGTVKPAVLVEIQTALRDVPPQNAHIYQEFIKHIPYEWTEIIADIRNAACWQDVYNKYHRYIPPLCKINRSRQIKGCGQNLQRYYDALKRRVFKQPRYRLRRRGFLVAFIGVDGAGKTSTIEYIENLDFFKRSGVKTMYFGNNAYWIPFLEPLLHKFAKTPFLKDVLFAFAQIDKQLRIIRALFYIWAGNIVLADRYFYDQEIGDEYINPTKKRRTIKSYIGWLLKPRMWKKPDITIFLNVSPEIAHQRKQDYSLAKMRVVNKAYKDYMSSLTNICMIDADQSAEKVRHDVVKIIKEFKRP